MNAVEIEQAVTDLAAQPFDGAEFPYAFLEAFGNKDAGIRRLRAGETNKSDLGGVLQQKNIHILVAPAGEVRATLDRLRASERNQRWKVRFLLATDGVDFEAEDLESGDVVACAYKDFPDHFGFFLPLAGITTVRQIQENAFDIRATSRLNRLYVELLRENPDWAGSERRHEMNHFMARLIFCFFAEDTNIFNGQNLFTATVDTMSDRDASNTHEVVSEIFRAMNVKSPDRAAQKVARWADAFPYVNGGLFSGSTDVPRFSKIARSYLVQVGNLDWTKINPDIFGSMIQAVADDEERGALGMHYTSVPNILKVLNPLFLDDLRGQLESAGDNSRQLLNLRRRLSKIRVFDPACGSGNFLVIAYKQMREIENAINERRGEKGRRTGISLRNFCGIELRDFPAEIARLALIIAEYQCDLLYRGQQEALAEFLPLESQNWITCDNALRVDWLSICPPTGTEAVVTGDDLFSAREELPGFENEGGETYICGNPPYIWANNQTVDQKQDILNLQKDFGTRFRGLDYVTGWLYKYAQYSKETKCDSAFVATNSITQGEQVDPLWSGLLQSDCLISFAHRSFKWQNLAKSNAGVSVVIIGLSRSLKTRRFLYSSEERIESSNISPYLLPMEDIWIRPSSLPINGLAPMLKGSQPTCGGGLILESVDARQLIESDSRAQRFVKNFIGSDEISNGKIRKCLWIEDDEVEITSLIPGIARRLLIVRDKRSLSTKRQTQEFAAFPHRFTERRRTEDDFIALPCVSSENREYLTPVALRCDSVISNRCFGAYGVPPWYFSVLSSKLHYCWCETTSGKLETRLNYSNTLTWNTFPVPTLTEKNRADLTRCAEDILLAREAHFPATIADLYDPETMPANLREAHERNDEVLERIYIGRRFKNDTERLEKLFDLYTKMTVSSNKPAQAKAAAKPRGKKA